MIVDRAPQHGDSFGPVGQRGELAGRQRLEGGADVEDVANFLGVEVTHRQAAPRSGRDQTLLLQLTHRLPKGAATDLQSVRQFRFHQVRSGTQLTRGDRLPQRGQRLLAQAGLLQSQQGGVSADIRAP